MARLESIRFEPFRSRVAKERVAWEPVGHARIIAGLPQLYWSNGEPWREANLWFLERAAAKEVDLGTVRSNATSVHAYAKWLEDNQVSWWDFPPRKEDRCLLRYRRALIDARDEGALAPSTATQRIRVIVNFYRWLKATGLLSPVWPLWNERTVGLRLSDPLGFERTITVSTTDLAIPNRRAPGERLEGGLLPVTSEDRDALLEFARLHATEELFLMLTVGFFTGMRLGTITDLKVSTLTRAVPDPAAAGLMKIAVGPAADPPVCTKFGVTGQIWISRPHLDALLDYAHSTRRLKREVSAGIANKDLLFLTRFGNSYSCAGNEKSAAVKVELHKLRKLAASRGLKMLRSFRFHQTRCTYATELARHLLGAGNPINAIAIVKEALLHKSESTSLKYIKFVERAPMKERAANAFTRAFLGLLSRADSGSL